MSAMQNGVRLMRAIEATGGKVVPTKDGYMCQCPAHDDTTPSLSISAGDDGRVLVHCHTGCETADVLAAVGMQMSDLFPDVRHNGRSDIVKTYSYVDEAGELLFEVVRKEPKAFRQRRPDGRGGWIWKLGGTRRVLYRLPEVIAAVQAGKTIYVVEGEKDADALVKAGVTATTNPGGAGKWRDEFSEVLAGATVRLVADHDDKGVQHARNVEASLLRRRADVTIMQAAAGKDAHDHLAAGHELDDFVRLDVVGLDVSSVGQTRTPPAAAPKWPRPPAGAAYYGLAGDFVRALAPHTEADPVALLTEFLVCFGNAIGRGPGLQIEGNFHATNEYVVLVGETSKARKGTAHGRVMQVMQRVDSEWASHRQCSGLVSGEGLIWEVRDPITKRRQPRKGEGAATDDDGLIEELEDAGISDKRLMVTESEFASVLAATCRTGNTLSPVVRDFWDKHIVRTAAKNSPARSTGAHVSIIGHITADELRRSLTATEKANGFANRMMFVCVRRASVLPFGGNLSDDDLAFIAGRVSSALSAAKDIAGSLSWGARAAQLWEHVYPDLSAGQPGMFGAVTARAEAHTIRLAVLYALTDGKRTIERAHMEAALALWDYCERSAAHVFGGRAGDQLADRLLEHMRRAGTAGVSRSELRDAISHKTTTERFDSALIYLERCMLAAPTMHDTGGRPAERWYAKEGEKARTGDESRDISPRGSFSPSLSDGAVEATVSEEARAEDVRERFGDGDGDGDGGLVR